MATSAPGEAAPAFADPPSRLAAAHAVGLTKIYDNTLALDHVDVAFGVGQLTAVAGLDGAGKTALLQCMTGYEAPTAGHVYLGGAEVTGLNPRRLHRLRRGRIGLVLHPADPIPGRSIADHIEGAVQITGRPVDRRWALHVARVLGIDGQLDAWLSEVAARERHAAELARVVAAAPGLLFVDEPEGGADARWFALLRRCVAGLGRTVVAATCDPQAAASADTVVFLDGGRVAGTLAAPTADRVRELLAARAVRPGRFEAGCELSAARTYVSGLSEFS